LGCSRAGQGLIEFTFVIPIVIFLVFGVFEMGRHYYTRLTLQHAVAEAARFAVTGGVLRDSISGEPMTRAESISEVIRRRATTLDVDVDRITLDPPDGGGPGDIVRVTADFTFTFVAPGYRRLFPKGALDFSVSTAMKNEPFWPSGGKDAEPARADDDDRGGPPF
jgi:hypothetical protein